MFYFFFVGQSIFNGSFGQAYNMTDHYNYNDTECGEFKPQ